MSSVTESYSRRQSAKSTGSVAYLADCHSEICHDVQCRRTDPCLGLLLRQGTRFHGVANDALVVLDGQLNIAAQAIVDLLAPALTGCHCSIDSSVVVSKHVLTFTAKISKEIRSQFAGFLSSTNSNLVSKALKDGIDKDNSSFT